MLLEKLHTPISFLNAIQFGVHIESVANRLFNAYEEYEWDAYLLQQNKISLIQSNLPNKTIQQTSPSVWRDIYTGTIKDSEIQALFPELNSETILNISTLKPTRKRCVSEYEMQWDEDWVINRVPSRPFSQSQGLIAINEDIDYRVTARRFKELPDELYDDDLQSLMSGVAKHIKQFMPSVMKLNFIAHHTVVYSQPGQISTNSPEGIHQDGVDFIVSAMVVERKNISGGKSIIYGKDKKTKLFQAELQPGQGIFQPDLGTELWHEATPISPVSFEEVSYRSTIGFDISVLS